RVRSTSTTHVTASELGTLTDPEQATLAKLSDLTINTLPFTRAKIVIDTVVTIYAKVTSLDLTGNEFSILNAAASSLNGLYTFEFLTQTSCNTDCGVAVTRPDIGGGNNCGYQYWVNAGNRKPGMGCQGNFAKS